MIGETDEHGGWTVGGDGVLQSERDGEELSSDVASFVTVVAHPECRGTVGLCVIGLYGDGGAMSAGIALSPAAAHELALQILARCALADA